MKDILCKWEMGGVIVLTKDDTCRLNDFHG